MTVNHAHESLFGPPSEPIDVSKFLQDAASRLGPGGSSTATSTLKARWENLTQEKMDAVQAECLGSIAELKSSVEDAWNNPILSAHLIKNHETAVGAIYDQADTSKSSRTSTTTAGNRGGRKRKRQDGEGLAERPEVKSLQEKLDAIQLTCWQLPPDSALFIRPSKNGDQNALTTAKRMGRGVLSLNQTPIPHSPDTSTSRFTDTSYPSPGQALITISIHNRIPWSHSSFSRVSQHVILSSQSLADLIEVIPCASNEIPDEKLDDEGHVIGYESGEGTRDQSDRRGFVFCVEGIIYDETDEGDNADKLLAYLRRLPEEQRPRVMKCDRSIRDTVFETLTLRVNEPYWLLHQGSCEHFVVVDQIRLPHPSDPPMGYPLTLQITPASLDHCRACTRVPAVYSIVGDMRLGESPCVLCAPCWRSMGKPRDGEEVMVVPLVSYEHASWLGEKNPITSECT